MALNQLTSTQTAVKRLLKSLDTEIGTGTVCMYSQARPLHRPRALPNECSDITSFRCQPVPAQPNNTFRVSRESCTMFLATRWCVSWAPWEENTEACYSRTTNIRRREARHVSPLPPVTPTNGNSKQVSKQVSKALNGSSLARCSTIVSLSWTTKSKNFGYQYASSRRGR